MIFVLNKIIVNYYIFFYVKLLIIFFFFIYFFFFFLEYLNYVYFALFTTYTIKVADTSIIKYFMLVMKVNFKKVESGTRL